MFEVEIKLKGDTSSYLSKFATFRINGGNYTIDNEKTLIALIDKYEPEQIYMKHKEKYYPIHNCYYKAKQDVFLIEGYENEL
jgi:hypothetical protein